MIEKFNSLWETLKTDPKPLRRILCKILVKLPFDAGKLLRIKVKTNGYRIHLRKSSLSLALFYDPDSRKTDCEFIASYLNDGDVYVDVGANVGTTLIPAALASPKGGHFGFEPHPRIYRYLVENVLLNGLSERVHLFNCALGATEGEIRFSSSSNDDTNHVLVDEPGIAVRVALLDDILAEAERVHLLKVDVEGYEKFVFQGGRETLAKTDCVYFEISEQNFNLFGYSVRELLTDFEHQGFALYVRSGPSEISRIRSDYCLRTHHTNVLAIRSQEDFLARTNWTVSSPLTKQEG
ncbi:FkbM family methyltransferase [Aureliella helgolandensis]|uniref:2-O-methyltransferase NoeI n=1 Tax=Aureliella helgolandensis TaxID=2527968 RepID=A0A518GE05_9BACT|nr:FkbM family methyltransferase [Aureliella helgolandensis]QDV26832.1 2-O-methyltransferase NoeI [Aureliella helgolandensis]